MSALLDRVARKACTALKPPPRTDLASWIEGHMILPEGMSSRPGPVRLWSYQRGICDAISDPEVERITVVKSARLGYTTLLTGMIASYVANDPSQILVVLPTDGDCRDYVTSEIEPVFAASPALRGKLSDDGDPSGRNTLASRRFPGGSIKFIGAKSPRNLRRHNVRVLIIDEAAAMDADSEAGSVVARAITRTRGFDDRKIVEGSTPLDETSNVLISYEASNRARFEVPCPGCGAFTFIEWKHIEWQPSRPETAAFRCPNCDVLVDEAYKPEMVAAGRWIARNPEVRKHAGFLINALVSPLANASWSKLVSEFLHAKDDPDLLRPFVNETLAEAWVGDANDVDDSALLKAAEPFGLNAETEDGSKRPIPPEVLAITIGTDVQDDRLECSVVGWSATQTFILSHQVIWGSPDEDETWQLHDELALSTWKHPHGGTLKVDALIIDSGDGDWTDKVYAYCFSRSRRHVMAGKGVSGSRPAWQPSQGKVKGGRLYLVGVDGIKTTIMNRLELGRSIRFSDTLEAVYFEQLTSERKVTKRFQGRPRRVWERKPGARAEALDCLVYAFSARVSLRINFEARAAAMIGQTLPAASAPRSPREQAEINRGGRPTPASAPNSVPIAVVTPQPVVGPRSPREQAVWNKNGGNPHAIPPIAAPTPARTPPKSWNELLGVDCS